MSSSRSTHRARLSRRALLVAPFALAPAVQAEVEWLRRDPAQWTSGQIDEILNHSPWTREVPLEIDPSAWGDAKKANPTEYTVQVSWDSALPLRLARRHAPAEGKEAEIYIVSVGRLPLSYLGASSGRLGGSGLTAPEVVEQLVKTASIERDGKDSIRAVSAEWLYDYYTSRVAIRFPRGRQPIERTDEEVTVRARVGTLRFRARFPLKQMIHRGRLEL